MRAICSGIIAGPLPQLLMTFQPCICRANAAKSILGRKVKRVLNEQVYLSVSEERLTFIHAGAVEDFGLPDGVPVLFHLRLKNTCNNRARREKEKKKNEKSPENKGGAPDAAGHRLTFQDNLQLVPQNVEDAVTGAGLRDDVAFQPSPARVLVEIITRLHRRIHVLQEPSGFETQRGGSQRSG